MSTVKELEDQIKSIVLETQNMMDRMTARIERQKDTISRLAVGQTARDEVIRLHEELTKACDRVKELEDYINRSGTAQIEVSLKPEEPLDPAEAGVGDTGNDPEWQPPVTLGRPEKRLPSI